MVKVFRPPTTLIASDLGREFEGALAIRTETDGTYLDPSGPEPPYQRGITERAGKTFKLCSLKRWRPMTVRMKKNGENWLTS